LFDAHYDRERFRFFHSELLESGLFNTYNNQTIIPKTAVFIGKNFNVFIDTSDGVNEDLKIQEYCGRIKRIIELSNGSPFLFFKSAYSTKWSRNIKDIAELHNGKVIPFFKWSFNSNFYSVLYGKKIEYLEKYKKIDKEYDVGIFFDDKLYNYPKPSESDNTISWGDHKKFNIPGHSCNTGYYEINSRNDIISKLKKSRFKVLHSSLPYEEYIKASFKCKVIINPPGIGEYTSRMVDQTYLGNCIVLRKNSYDNCLSWKSYLPEIDFENKRWESNLQDIINNLELHQRKSFEYYEKFWTSDVIVSYIKNKIGEYL